MQTYIGDTIRYRRPPTLLNPTGDVAETVPDTVPGDDSDQNMKPARSQVTLYALNSKHMYLFFLQAAIDLLSDFFPHIDNMLHTMIARGAYPSAGQHCCDGDTVRLHRCRDCFDGHPVLSANALRRHITQTHFTPSNPGLARTSGSQASSILTSNFISCTPASHAPTLIHAIWGSALKSFTLMGFISCAYFNCSCPGALPIYYSTPIASCYRLRRKRLASYSHSIL